MRNTQQILKEINELEQVKAAYLHFLCSPASQVNVENTTTIQENRIIITNVLSSLYTELMQVKSRGDKSVKHHKANKRYSYTKTESNAIMHFNRDKRFTITE